MLLSFSLEQMHVWNNDILQLITQYDSAMKFKAVKQNTNNANLGYDKFFICVTCLNTNPFKSHSISKCTALRYYVNVV